mgnify:CR=1 FL=1
MQIRASTALRNEYLQISQLAKVSGEPIYITNKGEADLVIQSIEAYGTGSPEWCADIFSGTGARQDEGDF